MGATVYISGNRSGMECVFEYDNSITDLNLPGQHILQFRELVHRPDTLGQHKS